MRNTEIDHLLPGHQPFCIIQKQDSEESLLLTGTACKSRNLSDIPRKNHPTNNSLTYDSISVIPYCQIRERGFNAFDEGEEILTIDIDNHQYLATETLLMALPERDLKLESEIQYDTDETRYRDIIRTIVDNEIGNGEGANFVIPRNISGRISSFSVATALSIFKSLVENDYGTYWKFIYYDTSKYFIGSTPERHLMVKDGKVKMNPISGTFRKDRKWSRTKQFKHDLLKFLNNQKEINELFMVVDEELKMMAKMCADGGTIIGPILKEMSQLIHSEYLLSGESDKDIIELFTDSMFAATVVGSPVENACNIIKKYSSTSRRYYGSALVLIGRDEKGRDFLDSPISIRTLEIAPEGSFHLSVGATLVKDSDPEEELRETAAKSSAILSTLLTPEKKCKHRSLLAPFANDDEIIETLSQRNQDLSTFWFFRQNFIHPHRSFNGNTTITLVHNEDDFIYMLQHMFHSMGINTSIIRFNDYRVELDRSDITLVGPGPGNPNNITSDKIKKNYQITTELIRLKKKALFVCLGHQILCKFLGFNIYRKKSPLQGSQVKIDLFGRPELVGFYNTFAPQFQDNVLVGEFATIPNENDLVALRNKRYIGFQFHPESLLTKNGYNILYDSVEYLCRDI